jgi:hypothetical protein
LGIGEFIRAALVMDRSGQWFWKNSCAEANQDE